jgi:protein-tyrosine phosphatase
MGESMPGEAAPGEAGVVVLCTANVCRSPMAAALLARQLAALGVSVPVTSAGMLADGVPALPEAVAVMAGHGLDLSAHRSRVVTAEVLACAGLVLAMARENLRHAVVMAPDAWPRGFTLKEFIRRGERTGPRPPGQPWDEWLSRIHAGRQRASLLGDAAEDDVPDPAGGPPPAYAATAALLADLMSRVAHLCWPRPT